MADDNIKLNTASAMASAVSDLSAASDDGSDPFADAKNELVTRFELLPDDIKGAIMDAGYQQKLFDIAKTQKLTYEELGVLETETTMVLLGMTKPAEYRDELQSELKKGDSDTDAIVKAVNEQVFTPVRASLERVYAAKKDPADYIPDSIMSGSEEKPKEPFTLAPTSADVPSVPAAPVSVPISTFAPAVSTPAPVPTPSYATSMPRPTTIASSMLSPSSLTSLEKNVLGNAGVVINAPAAPAAQAPVSEMPDRAKLLASIENPSRIAPNIVADRLKMAGSSITATKTTDYSMPQRQTPVAPTSQVPAKPYVDPYREPI